MWTIGIVAVLAVVVFIHFTGRVDDSDARQAVEQRSEPIQHAQLLDAAVERIESERVDLGPPVVSGTSRGKPLLHAPASMPVPPDGYSFVTFAGEMPVRSDNEIESRTDPTPPRPDWIDSTESPSALAHQAALAGREWTFGWLLLAPGESPSGMARTLAPLGVEVLGTAGRLLRARLPGDTASLRKIVATAGIDGLGATPAALKVPARFAQKSLSVPNERRPVFVTLMADDTDGEWRHELERLGAVAGRYDDAIRVYTATADYPTLTRLVAADFVLAVEPVGIVTAAHDTAAPAMGVDALRLYTGSPGEFSGVGGASVAIGVMDSGLNIRHADIATNRDSICGRNFVWLGSLEDEDLWIDWDGHGTHVTATLAGNGFAQARFAGMAPSVRHIRFAKVLNRIGEGTTDSMLQGMDFLAETSACRGSAEVMPLVVNMSLSGRGLFEGRGTSARKLDATVWDTRQLYVVAQANAGSSGFSNYASAKNSLAVGAAFDGGEIAPFSSHGPTADGRLAPLVVATGVGVCSAKGDGSPAGYQCSSGTSMASPAAAGVTALLMDAVPDYQQKPALVRSRLMASAIRPDAWLEDSAAFPLNNTNGPGFLQSTYGLGKVSARTGILDKDQENGWFGGGATAKVSGGEYAHQDIEVPDGATRLDIVMTWDEPPADTVVPPVLNNLDLWVDQGADCDGGPCGEHASTSRIDNVEWVIVRNPAPGTYRAKVVANIIYTSPPRAAVAWTVIRGPSTPSLQVAAESRPLAARDGRQVLELDVAVTADGYVAAGGRLHLVCRGDSADCRELNLEAVAVPREDGLDSDATFGVGGEEGPVAVALDSNIPLGEVAVGETQQIKLLLGYSGATPVRLYLVASAWNANGASTSVAVHPADGVGEHSEVSVPANDDLAAAETIKGKEGSTTIDLVRTTPEPGEPLYQGNCLNRDCYSSSFNGCPLLRTNSWFERPLGSAWYSWTAPDTDIARFRLAFEGAGDPAGVVLSLFDGDCLPALRQLAVNHWEEQAAVGKCLYEARRFFTDEIAFRAEQGKTYRVRVAAEVATSPLALHWFQGRPANDDFAAAEALTGPEGQIDGSNAGATLESGESFGDLAATVWYRWVAPSDGDWTFSIDFERSPDRYDDEDLRIAVFAGTGVGDVRLMSGFPGSAAHFRAANGTDYRIVVAAEDAFARPSRFELGWEPASSWYPFRDHFAQAEAAVLGEEQFLNLNDQTVEPDEPVETGIRTQWWSWTAPETRTYTWKFGRTVDSHLAVGIFRGTGLNELELAASNAADRTTGEFTFDGVEGEHYSISIGWPIGDSHAYLKSYARGFWRPGSGERESGFWQLGATPANDELAGAITLRSTRGLTLASTAYATTGHGESTDLLGRSSLWWIFEAPTTGWYRFFAVGGLLGPNVALAVYEGDALDTPVSRSGWLGDGNEVTFFASAGEHYTVRAGIQGYDLEDRYTLRWEPTDAPTWLRYADAHEEQLDDDGESTQLLFPGALAFDASGSRLFATTGIGLAVFERDASTGALTPTQTVDADVDGSSLTWDATRSRLLSDHCGVWQAFDADDENALTFASTDVTVADDAGNCGTELFTVGGSSVYRVVRDVGIDNFAIEESGDLRYVDSVQVNRVNRAAATNDGMHVLASTGRSLDAFERNAESGSLLEIDSVYGGGEPIAVTPDDRYVFVTDDRIAEDTDIYELGNDTLQRRDSLTPRLRQLYWQKDRRWRFAAARQGQHAVDLFGDDGAISIAYRSDELVIAEELGDGLDRFGNYVPLYGSPAGMAASPEGRHVYVSTPHRGILAFERIPADVTTDPYTRLDALVVSPGKVALGSEESEDCIDVSDKEIDGTTYTVGMSKWQTRPNADWAWADIADTETTAQICPRSPDDPGHYRLAADLDINGESGQYTSNVIVLDDHGDSISDATAVALPSTTEGWIENTVDHDYFGIEVEAAGTLVAFTEGWMDADGTLYGADGAQLSSDNDSGNDLNFHLSELVDPGTFFLRVSTSDGPGAYTLRVDLETTPPQDSAVFQTSPSVPIRHHQPHRVGSRTARYLHGSFEPGDRGADAQRTAAGNPWAVSCGNRRAGLSPPVLANPRRALRRRGRPHGSPYGLAVQLNGLSTHFMGGPIAFCVARCFATTLTRSRKQLPVRHDIHGALRRTLWIKVTANDRHLNPHALKQPSNGVHMVGTAHE